MTRRTCALLVAIAATTGMNAAHAATQWNFEDGNVSGNPAPDRLGDWQNSFGTPWSNIAVSPFAATDTANGYNFNIPGGFSYGGESLIKPGAVGAPANSARIWDQFVASNLMLIDFSVEGAIAPEGSTAQNQYVAVYPAFNGPGPAVGRPAGTFAFLNSYDAPQDDFGVRAQYQLVFSPGYYDGVRTHTLAWDYVNAGYDFSRLDPTGANGQDYTKVHLSTNTDAANRFAGRAGFDNVRVYRAKTTDPIYIGPAAGGTFTGGNFFNTFTSGTGAIAIFKKIDGASAATVDVTAPTTVGTLMLNNAPRTAQDAITNGTPEAPIPSTSYTFGGASTLTIDNGTGEGAIVAVDGDNAITAPLAINSNAVIDLAADTGRGGVPEGGATLAVNNVTLAAGKTLRTTSVGTLTINGNLTGGAGSTLAVNGGKTVLAGAGDRRISVGNLTVAPIARLDVTDNAVVVNYDAATPFAELYAATKNGFLNGATAAGIASSTADADQAVGIVEASAVALVNNQFLGQTVDGTTVLIRLTYRGDTNLDGSVAFGDLVALAQNYASGEGKLWSQGDTNYDGLVNFGDLVSLAQNYNKTLSAAQVAVLGADFAAEYALAQMAVPEPTTFVALGAAAMVFGRRRR